MSRISVSVRVRAVIFTALISIFAVSSPPLLSQEAEGGEETTEETSAESSTLFESTIVGDVDPSAAVTVEDLTVPVDQLELLVKPLTLEELQTEAAAWLLILKEKVQTISAEEVAIKRENRAVEEEAAAVKSVKEAIEKIVEAEASLTESNPGTPEHEQATGELEEAKEALQEAELNVEQAIKIVKELEEDKELQELIREGEVEEEITLDRQILEEAKKERDKLTAGSAAYDGATEKIDALDKALSELEIAEEELEGAVPDSPEFQELSETVTKARAAISQATKAVLDADLAPQISEENNESSVESDQSESVLENIDKILKRIEKDIEAEAKGETEGSGDSVEQLTQAIEELEELERAQADLKNQLVVDVTGLQGEQAAIVDRFSVILDELDKKGGDTASYRRYVDAVSSIELDVTDTEGLGVRLVSWLKSEEGGVRWGINILRFIGILLASIVASYILSILANRFLKQVNTSALFREFLVVVVKRGTVVVGFLLALTSLGISLGPILALVGGASFVLAFALQSNLGNFASGLMLLITKPFDVGDEVEVCGYWSIVDSITLASTRIKNFNGDIITLPNNSVWGGDIVNHTHDKRRRLSFTIHVKFSQDVDQIKDLWLQIAGSHPDVLENPPPSSFPWNSHYNYYLSFSLKAWSPTDIYWSVYIDLLKALQKGLAEADIDLVAPRQDIHLQQAEQALQQFQLQSTEGNDLPE